MRYTSILRGILVYEIQVLHIFERTKLLFSENTVQNCQQLFTYIDCFYSNMVICQGEVF